MGKIRVMLADDHSVLRESLARLINSESDMQVIAEVDNGDDACEVAQQRVPDVLIADISMPGLDGVKLARALSACTPPIRTIMLTMHEQGEFLSAALEAGARGYLNKRAASRELLKAIREVHEGRMCINVSLQDQASVAGSGGPSMEALPPPETVLSGREYAVLKGIAEGYSAKEIAEQIGIARTSVDNYRTRLTRKLGLKSRADLVRYALETGVIAKNTR